MASLQSKFHKRTGKIMWYAVINRVTDTPGQYKQKWIKLSYDRDEAVRMLQEIDQSENKAGMVANQQTLDFGETDLTDLYSAIDDFYKWLHINRNPGTVENYKYRLEPFKKFVGRGVTVQSVTPAIIEHYKGQMISQGLAKSTVKLFLAVYGCFWKYLTMTCGMQLDNPIAKVEKPKLTRNSQAKYLTKEQIDYLFELARNNSDLFYRDRDLFLFKLLYYTGLRRKEASDLVQADVDLNLGKIFVRHGKGDQEGWVPVCEELEQCIQNYTHKDKSDHMICTKQGKKLSGNAIRLIFNRYKPAFEEKFPSTPLYPHLLRHTFGSHLAMAGVSDRKIQRLMRHLNRRSTDVYLHLSDDSFKDEVNVLNS